MRSNPILRAEDVSILRGRSTVTLWRNVRDGVFPEPTREDRRVGWKRSVIEQWLREQEAKLRNEHQRIRAQLDQLCDAKQTD